MRPLATTLNLLKYYISTYEKDQPFPVTCRITIIAEAFVKANSPFLNFRIFLIESYTETTGLQVQDSKPRAQLQQNIPLIRLTAHNITTLDELIPHCSRRAAIAVPVPVHTVKLVFDAELASRSEGR